MSKTALKCYSTGNIFFCKIKFINENIIQGHKFCEILLTRLNIITDLNEFKGAVNEYFTLMFRGEGFV